MLRLSVALITRGRITRKRSPVRSTTDFIAAYEHSRALLGSGDIRTAQAALHVAIVALEARDFPAALELAETYIPTARRGQNAVLLSSFLAVKSASLAATGRGAVARAVQLDHLKWARYAYGDGNGERPHSEAGRISTIHRVFNCGQRTKPAEPCSEAKRTTARLIRLRLGAITRRPPAIAHSLRACGRRRRRTRSASARMRTTTRVSLSPRRGSTWPLRRVRSRPATTAQ